MKLSTAVKPISHIKSHASEVISEIAETGNPVIVTVNGEARVIIQDLKEYERDRESMAMLKMLAMGRKDMLEGRHKPLKQAFGELRKKIRLTGDR
ncbi:MAG: type II toxin-antitoxin system Phd/YefM family antitoxin [Nitrospiraceae bacterium]|nr:type II toxin-antitoxin system Phd/YefM family antitoxin [Nitrospiraceae bacterium]